MIRNLSTRCALTLALALCAAHARADVVLDWNRVAQDVLVQDILSQHPGEASRTMAMMNVAIYDAFAMTSPAGQTFYSYGSPAPGGASRDAAAVEAAYTVLSQGYPDLTPGLDADRTSSLDAIADGPAKDAGVALGAMIGQSIVGRRADDGYDAISQYMPSGDIGHWEPDPLNDGQEAWGPEWGNVRPFTLHSNSQFSPPPMPDMTTQEYAEAFNEVKLLGADDSPNRTADQTEAAKFWAYDRIGMGTPMRMYNTVLETVAEQEGNTAEENAELFARATVAMADAGIAAWTAKYGHDFWRPVSGIRRAADDDNPLTVADPDWVPMGAPGGDDADFTPPFPTYVSGHSTFGGALFTTLEEFYGTDDIAFTLVSDEVPGAERTYSSFSAAMAENGRSRVYLGVHFNFDDVNGRQLGQEVGTYIAARPFVAVPEPLGASLAGLACLGALGRRRRG